MGRNGAGDLLRGVLTATFLVACGGITEGGTSEPSGDIAENGLPVCETSALGWDTPCSDSALRCMGPCINSWQAERACENGVWSYVAVVACGPNADEAPLCRNEWGGGALTPCCPEGPFVCTDKPDGYPGFECTPGDGSHCLCNCQGGERLCPC